MATSEQLAFDLLRPERASVQPIAAIATVLRGRGPIYETGSGKLAVNQKCVRWHGVDLTHAKEVSEAWIKSLPVQSFLREGDIVVNSTGEGTIGRACVVSREAIGLPFDSHILVVRAGRDRVLPSYLAYYLRSPAGQEAIEASKSAKTTKQTELGAAKLSAIEVPVPPLAEQRRIVARIEELAARIKRARGLRREALAEVEIAAQRAAEGTIDQLVDTEHELGALLLEDSRNGLSQRPSDVPPGMPILRISAATSRADAIVDEGDYRFLPTPSGQDVSAYILQPGDLLACRFNGNLRYVGRFSLYQGYLDEPRVYPDKLIRFRVDTETLLPRFGALAMNSPKRRTLIEARCSTTAGNIGISGSSLRAVSIPVPPLSVQQAVVEFIDGVQSQANALKQLQAESAAELDALLPAVLERAFKGEM